ncbi:MAG TPA: hypothetical protein VEK82_14825 [Stellaceae bacterium]|nr:hypothetical protein [Stellaceae bacterium]
MTRVMLDSFTLRPAIITVARLRPVVADYFGWPPTDTALRRARQAGQIPAGAPGRNGSGSAAIDLRQALLVPLALASGFLPQDAPAAAERIAAFPLVRRDESNRGDPIRTPYTGRPVTLLDFMVSEVERCDADHPPSSWRISAAGACQALPDRLVFGNSPAALTDPSNEVAWSCFIPARLLADLAALFRHDDSATEAA